MRTLTYPKGTALVFTMGEYSDFGLCGTIVTIKDCDLPALAREYVDGTKARWNKDPGNFASWLVANGHAMPADVQQVHLGSYGEFAPDFGVPA